MSAKWLLKMFKGYEKKGIEQGVEQGIEQGRRDLLQELLGKVMITKE